MAADYLAGEDPRNPLASPLYADFAGLPPLLIQVGTEEALFDDTIRLDAHARTAGVETLLQVFNDVPHDWHLYAGMLPEARDAIEAIGAFVAQILDPIAAEAPAADGGAIHQRQQSGGRRFGKDVG
jgi:acetyl esterase/lipase